MPKTDSDIMNGYNDSMGDNTSIRVVSYSKDSIELSNGIVLTNKNDIRNFRRHIKVFNKNFDFDSYYSTYDETIRKSIRDKTMSLNTLEMFKDDSRRENMRIKMIGRIPYNKGVKRNIPSWNKGLTKYDDHRLMKISIDRSGDRNPQYGKPQSESSKQKQRNSIRESILSGKFTPNSNNRLTHKKIEFNGLTYRSSWEVFFHLTYPEFEYEKLRIKYGDGRVYISDFFDKKSGTIYEIKPKNILKREDIQLKMKAVEQVSSSLGYSMVYVTEDELICLYNNSTIISSLPDEIHLKLKMGLKI